MAARDLRIVCWNADGLLQRQDELKYYLEHEKIDICLISETHFNNQSYLKLNGYKVYHTVHPNNNGWGGSAILIKQNIIHYEDIKYQTQGIQASTIVVKCQHTDITVSAIYCPPRNNLKKCDYLAFMKQLGETFVIGGDFNAKHTHWGSRLTLTRGRELLEAALEMKCNFHSTGKPTYWPTDHSKIPDLIDFFITRNISSNYIKIEEADDLFSDHSAILMTLSDKVILKEAAPHLSNKSTNWEGFKISLENRIDLKTSIKTNEELDFEVNKFITDIQQSAWENTQEIKNRLKGWNLPKEIKELVQEKKER